MKYFAFISYNHKDTSWGKSLQRKLENYRLPAVLCKQHGLKKNPLRPLFFAPTDILPGGLSAELQDRLRDSQNLIVICSPNSAKSRWVGEEISFFYSLGRADKIHLFIIDGLPGSDNPETDCYHPILKQLGIPEILGANVHEEYYKWPWLNRERAYVQIISKLLGLEYDQIWQRHKRSLIRRTTATALVTVSLILAFVIALVFGHPVDISVSLNENTPFNKNLPQIDSAILTLHLKNEAKRIFMSSIDENASFSNIPHRYLRKEVNLHFEDYRGDYYPVDTLVKLSRNISINISRDPSKYGRLSFEIWSISEEKIVSNVDVCIDGRFYFPSVQGAISFDIPIELQKEEYLITSSIPLLDTVVRASQVKGYVIRAK